MLLFLFHFLVINMQLIHLFHILHLICVSYLRVLHVPIPLSLSTILGGWETGKDGEGTMSGVVLALRR